MKNFVTALLSASVVASCSSYSGAFVIPALPSPSCAGARTSSTGTAAAVGGASAALTTSGRGKAASRRTIVGVLSAENPGEKPAGDEEQEPMDLDLEQMFEVFEAADKEVSDADVGKKAGETKKPPAKDAGDAMSDMLSGFFGGGGKK